MVLCTYFHDEYLIKMLMFSKDHRKRDLELASGIYKV